MIKCGSGNIDKNRKEICSYLPKGIINLLKVKEGGKVKTSAERKKIIVVEIIGDPVDLALHEKKFVKNLS